MRRMHPQPLSYLRIPRFLESEEARPIRILAEYLEPLRRFKAQDIQDTVVFFGSARIHSREHAEQALERLERRFGTRTAAERDEHLLRGKKAVEWSRYYEEARELAYMFTNWTMSLDAPTTASSSPPAAAPASWKRRTAAPTRPAARPSA